MMLTASEEQALVRRAQNGNRAARDQLLRAFKPLVEELASRYSDKKRGIEREELESAGTEALLAKLGGLVDYDPLRARLSTWLSPSIEGAIREAAGREARAHRDLERLGSNEEGEESQSELERQGTPDPDLAVFLGEEVGEMVPVRRGADSPRDPYLRTDRFSNLKAELLAFMRASDSSATIHELTWQKVTRSPAFVSLLEEIRAGEESMARLEQEYRNLAPLEHAPRVPRSFSLRDARSEALSRITRHAAEMGSLPVRVQVAARGITDGVSSVQHFRRWVLGGQPAELWPEPGERFLAAERWVEEQAQREPTPDPEHVLAYGDGKLRAIARGGALDALKHCAAQLVHQFGWSEEQAVSFIVTGFANATVKLHGGVHAGGVYGACARIVMEVDPRTSPEEVGRLYARWRKALETLHGNRAYPDRDRAMNDRTLALAVFVEEHWPGGSWRDLRASWNEAHPEWRFPDETDDPAAKNFANHARQAWSRLSGECWPAETRVARRPRQMRSAGGVRPSRQGRPPGGH